MLWLMGRVAAFQQWHAGSSLMGVFSVIAAVKFVRATNCVCWMGLLPLTRGFELDVSGHASRVGVRLVHGAYALVVWDPGAIYGYKKVALT